MASFGLMFEYAHGQQRKGKIVSVEGADVVYEIDQGDGSTATVRMPSQSSADIKTEDPNGFVKTTIIAIDTETNRVKLRSEMGQRIVLELSPDKIKQMQINALFVLNVSR